MDAVRSLESHLSTIAVKTGGVLKLQLVPLLLPPDLKKQWVGLGPRPQSALSQSESFACVGDVLLVHQETVFSQGLPAEYASSSLALPILVQVACWAVRRSGGLLSSATFAAQLHPTLRSILPVSSPIKTLAEAAGGKLALVKHAIVHVESLKKNGIPANLNEHVKRDLEILLGIETHQDEGNQKLTPSQEYSQAQKVTDAEKIDTEKEAVKNEEGEVEIEMDDVLGAGFGEKNSPAFEELLKVSTDKIGWGMGLAGRGFAALPGLGGFGAMSLDFGTPFEMNFDPAPELPKTPNGASGAFEGFPSPTVASPQSTTQSATTDKSLLRKGVLVSFEHGKWFIRGEDQPASCPRSQLYFVSAFGSSHWIYNESKEAKVGDEVYFRPVLDKIGKPNPYATGVFLANRDHDLNKDGGYVCELCNKSFQKLNALEQHQQDSHSSSATQSQPTPPGPLLKGVLVDLEYGKWFIREEHQPVSCPKTQLYFVSANGNSHWTHNEAKDARIGEEVYFRAVLDKVGKPNPYATGVYLVNRSKETLFGCSLCSKAFSVAGAVYQHQKDTHKAELENKLRGELVSFEHGKWFIRDENQPVDCPKSNLYFVSAFGSSHWAHNESKLARVGDVVYFHRVTEKVGKPNPYASGVFLAVRPDTKEGAVSSNGVDWTNGSVGSGEKQQHTCDFCGKSCKSDGSLRQHMRDLHGAQPPPIVCSLCGKDFQTESSMQQHCRDTHGQPESISSAVKDTGVGGYTRVSEEMVDEVAGCFVLIDLANVLSGGRMASGRRQGLQKQDSCWHVGLDKLVNTVLLGGCGQFASPRQVAFVAGVGSDCEGIDVGSTSVKLFEPCSFTGVQKEVDHYIVRMIAKDIGARKAREKFLPNAPKVERTYCIVSGDRDYLGVVQDALGMENVSMELWTFSSVLSGKYKSIAKQDSKLRIFHLEDFMDRFGRRDMKIAADSLPLETTLVLRFPEAPDQVVMKQLETILRGTETSFRLHEEGNALFIALDETSQAAFISHFQTIQRVTVVLRPRPEVLTYPKYRQEYGFSPKSSKVPSPFTSLTDSESPATTTTPKATRARCAFREFCMIGLNCKQSHTEEEMDFFRRSGNRSPYRLQKYRDCRQPGCFHGTSTRKKCTFLHPRDNEPKLCLSCLRAPCNHPNVCAAESFKRPIANLETVAKLKAAGYLA